MSTTVELTSIGQAAALLQRHPSSIRKAAGELGIEPRYRINDVPHYFPTDLERIVEHLNSNQGPR